MRWTSHAWRVVLLASIVFGLICAGLWVRDRTWEWTHLVRFNYDIDNGFNWGKRANTLGYFSIYERLGEPKREGEKLDYAPLRLGVMTYWVSGLRRAHLDEALRQRDPSAAFHAPLLTLNTIMGLATALGTFFVARHVARWRPRAREPSFWDGTWIGLIVAGLTWLNPLILYNAHAWPQWDIWPMPFFVFAIYCGLRKWWLSAGLLIGLGACFKGQILMVGWTFPLWALLIGDWRGAIRAAVGIPTTILLIGLPWIVTRFDPDNQMLRVFDLWDRDVNWFGTIFITFNVLAATIVPLVFRRKFCPTLVAFFFATSAWLTMKHFGGTNYWLLTSFDVGTWNRMVMFMGPTMNLPALLTTYRWDNIESVVCTVPWLNIDLTMKAFLLTIFFGLSLLCVVMAAIRHRQRDPRLILALCLPWALFHTIPAQIHERYLLFIAACVPMFLVAGVGWFLLGLFFVVLGLASTLGAALPSRGIERGNWDSIPATPWEFVPQQFWGFVRYLIEPMHPGAAWALLMVVAIFIGGLFSLRRRKGEHADLK